MTSTGVDRMVFVDGQVLGPAVDLARACEHDASRGIAVAHRLEDGKLRPAIRLEVGERVVHGVEVACLPDEVEDDVGAVQQPDQYARVANVTDLESQLRLDARDVVESPALKGLE